MHCKNTSGNSRGCVKRAVGKSGEVSSSDISVNCSISANMSSKGTTQIPCFTVGQDKRNFGSKSSTESTQCRICILNPCFVINCRTMRSSDGASRSGPLLQMKQFSLSLKTKMQVRHLIYSGRLKL